MLKTSAAFNVLTYLAHFIFRLGLTMFFLTMSDKILLLAVSVA